MKEHSRCAAYSHSSPCPTCFDPGSHSWSGSSRWQPRFDTHQAHSLPCHSAIKLAWIGILTAVTGLLKMADSSKRGLLHSMRNGWGFTVPTLRTQHLSCTLLSTRTHSVVPNPFIDAFCSLNKSGLIPDFVCSSATGHVASANSPIVATGAEDRETYSALSRLVILLLFVQAVKSWNTRLLRECVSITNKLRSLHS